MGEARGRHGVTVRLAVALVALVAAFVAGAVAPRDPYFDALFGVEAYRELGLGVLAAAAGAVAAVVAMPAVGEALARAAARAGGALRGRVGTALLLLCAALAFALLPTRSLHGDAVTVVQSAAHGSVYPSNALASYLHALAASVPGVDPLRAVQAVSCLSGVAFAWAAVGIGAECSETAGGRATIVALLLTCGSAALFFGSLEVYAPVTAGVALYLLVGLRFLRARGGAAWPPLVMGTTFVLHGSAAALLPSLAWLANDGRRRPVRWRRLAVWGALAAVPVVIVGTAVFFVTWGGEPPPAGPERYGGFLGSARQAPLLELVRTPANLVHRYVLLDAEHLVGVLNLYALAAPAGLLFLLLFGVDRGDRRTLFVASVAVFLALFPVVWNVNYSLRRDWELFAPLGVPLALLGGLALLRARATPAQLVGAVAISLFAFAPLVVSNATGRKDVREYAQRVSATFQGLADLAVGERRAELRSRAEHWSWVARNADPHDLEWARSRVVGLLVDEDAALAERVARAGLVSEPHDDALLVNLGFALMSQGKVPEAIQVLESAARAEPGNVSAWYNLASLLDHEGRTDEAVRALTRAVRVGAFHPHVGEALRLLEELHRKQGDAAAADAVRAAADAHLGR